MDAEPMRGRSDARRRTAGAILHVLSGAFNPLRGQVTERALRADKSFLYCNLPKKLL